MSETIVCSVEEAFELLEHVDKDAILVLAIINRKKHLHQKTRKINKENGEEYIRRADSIFYQNNDFFGMLSLYGVLNKEDRDTIHNILFPQSEQKANKCSKKY